jgi:hypothetical protein
LAEGERTFKISTTPLKAFLVRSLEKLIATAKGREVKALLDCYYTKEQTDG